MYSLTSSEFMNKRKHWGANAVYESFHSSIHCIVKYHYYHYLGLFILQHIRKNWNHSIIIWIVVPSFSRIETYTQTKTAPLNQANWEISTAKINRRECAQVSSKSKSNASHVPINWSELTFFLSTTFWFNHVTRVFDGFFDANQPIFCMRNSFRDVQSWKNISFFHIENDIDWMETAFETGSILFKTNLYQLFRIETENINVIWSLWVVHWNLLGHTQSIYYICIILFHFSSECELRIENREQQKKNPPPVVVLMFVHKYSI